MKKLPAESLFIDAATELGVERAFIEKDWYAVQVIDTISNMDTNHITPIFSGGTSLSKGAKLIKRFSEDIDFRLQFDDTANKNKRKQFKHQIISLLETVNGIKVNHDGIFSANESKFFKIPLRYDALFEKPNFIRDELLVEFTFSPPNDNIEKKQIQTFIAELSQSDDKIFIQCVSPCEIAADKLSALIWRVIFRNRQDNSDDPTFIRHLHDLAALHTTIKANLDKFISLFNASFAADQKSPKRNTGKTITESTQHCFNILIQDKLYQEEYNHFVQNMSYADSDENITFENAVEAVRDIIALVS